MDQFVIQGGYPIGGEITASGNKNAALPVLACALMADSPVTIGHLPRIGDIETMLELYDSMGVKLDWLDPHTVRIDSSNLQHKSLAEGLCKRIRGSILLAAPLLYRFGEVTLPFPGGDRIGRRRLDTHLLALMQLGADVKLDSRIRITLRNGFVGGPLMLDEASVTATENTVMAAAVASDETKIANAACEPHVQQLCQMLNLMGGEVVADTIGTNRLKVIGKKPLSGCRVDLEGDYLEVISLMVLAAATGGELTIRNAATAHLNMILRYMQRVGMEATVLEDDVLFVPRGQPLTIYVEHRGMLTKMDSSPWPGFPADLTSIATVAATQAKGEILIFEKMYESRMFFVDQLIEMGARIVLCDPHRAVVIGPNRLMGTRMTSPDIRAGMALVVAALCAEGQSVISNIVQVDRGYERIDERLRALGAKIERG